MTILLPNENYREKSSISKQNCHPEELTWLRQVKRAMNDFSSVWGVGGHFVLGFSGFPPSLAPWTGAPCSRTFAYMG
jgi:hypothetical protein